MLSKSTDIKIEVKLYFLSFWTSDYVSRDFKATEFHLLLCFTYSCEN